MEAREGGEIETDEERSKRYEKLFRRLDMENKGQLDFEGLKEAFKKDNHPLRQNDDAMAVLFHAMDTDNDNVISFEDFKKYASMAESQIERGFQKLDLDHDGRIRLSEVSQYLAQLNSKDEETAFLNQSKSSLSNFVNWAFYRKPKSEEQASYITYDQWRDFLMLVPRKEGSRLHAAYSYFSFMEGDMDLSSEGDMTLINDFIHGFGFFMAGGISGVISRTCTAPLDRLKVFLIARTDLSSTFLNSKEKVLAHNPHANSSKIRSPIVKAIRTLYRQGGIRAFYVGNGLNAIKVFPESSMKFGSFEVTKKLMSRLEGTKGETENMSKLSTYIAGGLAGVVSQFSVYPIDTLKFRVQCAPLDDELKGNKLLFKTARDMYRAGGLRTFYRGVLVGVTGIFPYAALDLGTFSALKKWYIANQACKLSIPEDQVSISNLIVLPMGAFSGTVGATVVYPVNLLRTRLQAQGTYAHPSTYTGFRDVLSRTVKAEGIPGLFKGLVPNLLKVCPAVSISYLCYENLKKFMRLE
ncbi:ZYBA0S04-07998g1_1 [Zygosaccharomyces bailii CLIB 213]|uniref:ZYBA0S04-07998g1_1 n=1 Tax=Zygosaccharomyces bailii (strain CLIB 213 / ATCC 58445 / CBS 680 / BCRC 21525 / NBRC 1098 / NCYC 1416 / NRRL Y-2227) TaxID=1333698 RepID=A0A8J2T7S9_ZYGB2|nr:ZYBA0S04-07998g1_1 [Zygosaccharomyces bailii CLIB 213]